MPLRILALGAILVLAAACGKEPQPSAALSSTNAASASESESAAGDASTAALLGDLTQAVRKFSAEQRRVPKNLEELVSQGYITQVPTAPAGKAFAISKNLQVYLASH